VFSRFFRPFQRAHFATDDWRECVCGFTVFLALFSPPPETFTGPCASSPPLQRTPRSVRSSPFLRVEIRKSFGGRGLEPQLVVASEQDVSQVSRLLSFGVRETGNEYEDISWSPRLTRPMTFDR